VRAVANPFIIKASGVRLHNFATEHFINDEILDVFENGEKIQKRAGFEDKKACSDNTQA